VAVVSVKHERDRGLPNMSKRLPQQWQLTNGGGVACPAHDRFLLVGCQYAHVVAVGVYEEASGLTLRAGVLY
jgi:hypothetical protein